MLDIIKKCIEMNMASPWTCQVCDSVWSKITKEVKQVANKAADNEKRIEGLETSDETFKSEIANMQGTIKTLQSRLVEVEKGQGENS